MLHPSYHDLMSRVNSEVETGEAPIVNSRYSIVLATAKRARQLIEGVDALTESECPKPLSVAIDELAQGEIHILSEEEALAAEQSQEFGEEASVEELEELAVSAEDEVFGEEEAVSEESSVIE
ncbi:MAG: DNA-directed RNA polymerase subunit omega [Lachnospiraceae bacterium]|nr:DNA-directed RNA polymerase subunit omega [Lachnospiraceae bacterium]